MKYTIEKEDFGIYGNGYWVYKNTNGMKLRIIGFETKKEARAYIKGMKQWEL